MAAGVPALLRVLDGGILEGYIAARSKHIIGDLGFDADIPPCKELDVRVAAVKGDILAGCLTRLGRCLARICAREPKS